MANFERIVDFSVSKAGTGAGSVTSDLGGIDCGATCEGEIPFMTTVTLTAVAATGSVFTGWTGECSGTSLTCTVRLYDPRSVTATFDVAPLTPVDPPEIAPIDPPEVPRLADLTPAPPGAVIEAPIAPIPVVTAPVAKARPALRIRPKITGRARAGKTLVCTRGAWSGSPSGYLFTWRRDGKVVGHGSRRLVHPADRGHALRCEVTARNAAGAIHVASLAVRIPR